MRIHSLLSPKCRAQTSDIDGCGVFAVAPILAGEIVAVWGGKVYSDTECKTLSETHSEFESHAIEVCPGYWLGSPTSGDRDDTELFNHSCVPNIGIQGQIVLIARQDIALGQELVIDYETLEMRPQDFVCLCGSPNCRRILTGNRWRDPSFRHQHEGFLAWQIERAIRAEFGSDTDPDCLPFPPPQTNNINP